jgi:hypothetical protein
MATQNGGWQVGQEIMACNVVCTHVPTREHEGRTTHLAEWALISLAIGTS